MNWVSDDFDISQFPCNLMENFKNRQMFKNRSHITNTLKIRGSSIKAKRKIVMTANTPLFYVFGYTLRDRPWLNYGGKYEHSN